MTNATDIWRLAANFRELGVSMAAHDRMSVSTSHPTLWWLGSTTVNDPDLRAVLDEYLRAWERCDTDAMEMLLAEDFAHEVNGRIETRPELIERVRSADAVLSRRRFHVDALVAADDTVAAHCRLVGLHTGDLPVSPPMSDLLGVDSVAATGREVTITGMIMATIADGQLLSGYGEWNTLTMLTQMLGDR